MINNKFILNNLNSVMGYDVIKLTAFNKKF